MQKLDVKNSKNLIALCTASYFVSYLTRINFAAVIAAVIADGTLQKGMAGAVTTVGFITYGVGQLISGKLGDHMNPRNLMFTGFITTALMNFIIPFCQSGVMMCAVWGVNGFAQSLMWPPMVKIMKVALDSEKYNKGCVAVSWGSTAATIMIYLISPAIISVSSWHFVFYTVASVAAIMSVIWFIKITGIEKSTGIALKTTPTKSVKSKSGSHSMGILLLALVMGAIFLQGCLRDGVTTWVPTYISEVFSLGSEISILSGVAVPIFSLISIQLTSIFFNKMNKDPFKCTVILFLISAFSTAMLTVLPDVSVIITVFFSALTVACMHGINLILVCFLPAIYADEEHVSSLSGTLNFMTYVGSAASTYGFALLSESFGWGGTVISWLIISALGAAACLASKLKSKKQS